jgi:hypothetical protein
MTHEVPQPERENTPAAQLFNVDAMSDEQIIAVFRGLEGLEFPTREVADIVDGLFKQMAADMHDLVSRDPERVRNLVHRCEQSNDDASQLFSAYVAPVLVYYDYEFTRDTLISLSPIGEAARRNPGGIAGDIAQWETEDLMRDHLTPEQIADFQAHAALIDSGWPLEPSLPDQP